MTQASKEAAEAARQAGSGEIDDYVEEGPEDETDATSGDVDSDEIEWWKTLSLILEKNFKKVY